MTGNGPTRSTWSEDEPAPPPGQGPDTARSAGDPGYLTETGQAAGEDGSVAPVIVRAARRRGVGLGYRRPAGRARRRPGG